MDMRSGVMRVVIGVALVAVPSLAHADGIFSIGSFAPRVVTSSREDATMRARRTYEVLAALPMPKETRPAFDPQPVVDQFTAHNKFRLTPTIELTFPLAITGKSLVTADIGGKAQLAVVPTGFGQGGVFTFASAF